MWRITTSFRKSASQKEKGKGSFLAEISRGKKVKAKGRSGKNKSELDACTLHTNLYIFWVFKESILMSFHFVSNILCKYFLQKSGISMVCLMYNLTKD